MAVHYYISRFQIQADLVLLLYDDLTDRPADEKIFRIRSSHSFQIERKQGGILVFLNTPKTPYEIVIESPFYGSRTLFIEPTEGMQMKKIRMIPGVSYPPLSGTVCVSGCAQPGASVYLACDTGERFLHLKEDYKPADGPRIGLYCKEEAELEGKQICLFSERGKERCCLEESLTDDGFYRIDRTLSCEYTKIGTRALPVYEGRADENGWYQIRVKEPVKSLMGWSQNGDGSEIYREYAAETDTRIELSFI